MSNIKCVFVSISLMPYCYLFNWRKVSQSQIPPLSLNITEQPSEILQQISRLYLFNIDITHSVNMQLITNCNLYGKPIVCSECKDIQSEIENDRASFSYSYPPGAKLVQDPYSALPQPLFYLPACTDRLPTSV